MSEVPLYPRGFLPLGGLRGFRPPANPREVGAILSFETALELVA